MIKEKISLSNKEVEYLELNKNVGGLSVHVNDILIDWMRNVNDGVSRLSYNSYQTLKVIDKKM